MRIAVLASGRGSNLQALLDAERAGAPYSIVLVAGDKPQAQALRRAEAAGIETFAAEPHGFASRADFDRALFGHVASRTPDLVVLAGYLRILTPEVIAPWAGRMINIHPSLLPKYPGLATHRRVLEARDAEHGATVHFVTAELDGGPRIANVRIAVQPGDTPERLAERLLPLEHRLLTACVAAIANGEIRMDGTSVVHDGAVLEKPLALAQDGSLARVRTLTRA